MRVLLTGATGFIGQQVGQELVRRGHQVVAVARAPSSEKFSFPCEAHTWEATKAPLPPAAAAGVEAVIHLAGESIAQRRWSAAVKKKLLDSRSRGTENLLSSLPSSVKVLVGASAIGIYGERGEEELTEESGPGGGFLAEICQEWEAKMAAFPQRKAIFRLGVVLGRGGGALSKMIPPYRDGYGGALGSGQQWMSWIHRSDLVQLLVNAVESSRYSGVYNAVAPQPVRNVDFSRQLAERFGRKLFLPVPKLALKLVLGEMSEALLGSQKVLSSRLKEVEFQFSYPDLKSALQEAVSDLARFEEELVVEQWVPQKPAEIFHFFEDEKNLEEITPPWLGFKVLRKSTERVRQGTEIFYRLSLHGLPLTWKTVIAQWRENHSFTDVQEKGPYRKWHHLHEFIPLGQGTLLRDRVRYQLPLSALGRVVAGAKVDKDVAAIFKYRCQVIAKRYCVRGD